MLRFLRCYYLHFTRHSELLRASLTLSYFICFVSFMALGYGYIIYKVS